MKLAFTLPLALAFTFACVATPAQQGPQLRSSQRVLVGADLAHPSALNAFDLIRVRRPEFLSLGGPASQDTPIIYVDDSIASVQQLRLIPTDVLLEIRYLTAADATFRFGLGHSGGAIVVTTKREQSLAAH